MVDYFTNGQRCDETNDNRKATVTFTCCIDADMQTSLTPSYVRVANIHPSTQQRIVKNGKAAPELGIYIDSIVETQICQYDIAVCVPSMCYHLPVQSADDVVTKANSKRRTPSIVDKKRKLNDALKVIEEETSLVKVVEALSKNCLYRQNDWWTYEVCFGTGIRQFHTRLESVHHPSGATTQTQVRKLYAYSHTELAFSFRVCFILKQACLWVGINHHPTSCAFIKNLIKSG